MVRSHVASSPHVGRNLNYDDAVAEKFASLDDPANSDPEALAWDLGMCDQPTSGHLIEGDREEPGSDSDASSDRNMDGGPVHFADRGALLGDEHGELHGAENCLATFALPPSNPVPMLVGYVLELMVGGRYEVFMHSWFRKRRQGRRQRSTGTEVGLPTS